MEGEGLSTKFGVDVFEGSFFKGLARCCSSSDAVLILNILHYFLKLLNKHCIQVSYLLLLGAFYTKEIKLLIGVMEKSLFEIFVERCLFIAWKAIIDQHNAN